jgi:hypothetical protein
VEVADYTVVVKGLPEVEPTEVCRAGSTHHPPLGGGEVHLEMLQFLC